jgi:sugar O-acyltransferase (sialic acid O-acetyltransferase NeuD family)
VSRLVIVGAGDHGRGTLEVLLARRAAGLDTPEPLGFVDDDAARHGARLGGLPVLGASGWLAERFEAGEPLVAVIALAAPVAKRALAERLEAAGARWQALVHPTAVIGSGTVVGPGTIVGAGVVVAYDTRIGRHTTINLNATVGHDCEIGNYATIAPGVNVTGRVSVGEGAEIQTNATIVPGVRIGAHAEVGPGSVVLRDVGEGDAVFGNPARRMPRLRGLRT